MHRLAPLKRKPEQIHLSLMICIRKPFLPFAELCEVSGLMEIGQVQHVTVHEGQPGGRSARIGLSIHGLVGSFIGIIDRRSHEWRPSVQSLLLGLDG